MFTVESFLCPSGITPNSGITGPNNTHTHTHTHMYIYRSNIQLASEESGCGLF